jgi:hypothetical protein
MAAAFQDLKQMFNVIVAFPWRQTHPARHDDKPLCGPRLLRRHETQAEKVVHRGLEGRARAADLLFKETSYVVVKGEVVRTS